MPARSAWAAMASALRRFDVQNGVIVAPSSVPWHSELTSVALMSLLFIMWGLAYGLLDIMNYHIKVILSTPRKDAAYLAMAYYFAYPVGALLLGGPIIKTCGYRFAAMLGLLFLAAGMEFMSLGAAALNLSGMSGAHFVVGIGVSVLERCANPYVVNAGPRSRAATRILFAQSFAAIGTVIAPQLANAAIFDPTTNNLAPLADPFHPGRCLMPTSATVDPATGGLNSVVVFYRILGACVFGLAFVLGLIMLRTHLVLEVEVPVSPATKHTPWKVWQHPLISKKFLRLWYGVVANFFNLGCQVAVAQFFMEHVRVNACRSQKTSAEFMMVAQGLFVVGRLAAFGLTLPWWHRFRITKHAFKARWVLLAFLLGAVAFTGAGIGAQSKAALACICLVMFWEAPSFPMVFESATAGFEEWTSTAESLMICSIMGGGFLPVLMGLLTDDIGVSKAWILVTVCFSLTATYAVTCNAVPSFKSALDEAHGEREKVEHGDIEQHQQERDGSTSTTAPIIEKGMVEEEVRDGSTDN